MIIYIHGFGGSGVSSKAIILKEKLKKYNFIAPSLSYIPELAIDTLKELIESFLKYEKVYLIGSSLGGYYATYLADYFDIPAVLINPAVNPEATLYRYIGKATNFYDNSAYEWNKKYLETLHKYYVNEIKPELYFLLSQKGDELLNYMEGVIKFKDTKSIIENNGSHRFEGIEKHVNNIIHFFN